MRRILVPLALAALAAAGGYALLRRPARTVPQNLDPQPFETAPMGQGMELRYRAGDIPIRALDWARPLPGGAAAAQLLSQSGRQQVFLFRQGQLAAACTLTRPDGLAAGAFDFAELADAALVADRALLLLYRVRSADTPALLIAWDLAESRQAWAYAGQGSRLAVTRDGGSVFLYGGPVPVQVLPVDARSLQLRQAPTAERLALPAGVTGATDLLPTGGNGFLLAHPGGLAAYRAGQWSLRPAPAPSVLSFSPGQGTLAASGRRCWWQPEPGRLQEVAADGSLVAEVDLAPLTTGPHARDAALLRLLGADASGDLWFSPVAPTFHPPAGAGVPAPGEVPVIPGASSSAEPPPVPATEPPGAPTVPPPDPAADWAPYLQAGLGRLYRWTPGAKAMQSWAWDAIWPGLGAPADLPRPQDDGGLVPASGGFLLGGRERRWWLPLPALAARQPR